MKKTIVMGTLIILTSLAVGIKAQEQQPIRLIIRGDDIGSSHAANLGCIQSYREGIMRSVEIMVPCPWFPEAVKMLKANPGLDVGVHLTLTSEWENIKWRPLTHAPSLTDEDGYFFPVIWPNQRFPKERALKAQYWDINEIEKEFRAQIEMAKRHLPRVSHLTCHMGCSSWDDKVRQVYGKLAKEYGLDINTRAYGVERFPLEDKGETLSERIDNFIACLKRLEPGRTYLYLEHPALDTPEMKAVGHSGYYGVNLDRDLVTKVFTSPQVRQVIQDRGIQLISYADLAK